MQPDEYRKMAEVEDAMWYYRALHRHVLRSLTGQLPSGPAAVLDAGCGTGGLLRRLQAARPDWRLTGLDFSPLACALARERTHATLLEGSIDKLPFADGVFDAVISCDVVCQVTAPELAVREFARTLKPGAVVVMTMPAYQWMYSYHDRAVGNLRRYSRLEVAALLRSAGLTVLQDTYWNMLPFPLAVARRKLLPPAAPTSDVHLFPRPIEAGFNALMGLEHGWLSWVGRLPFGSSVLTVAKKIQQSA